MKGCEEQMKEHEGKIKGCDEQKKDAMRNEGV
jgi:hypothetical protein